MTCENNKSMECTILAPQSGTILAPQSGTILAPQSGTNESVHILVPNTVNAVNAWHIIKAAESFLLVSFLRKQKQAMTGVFHVWQRIETDE